MSKRKNNNKQTAVEDHIGVRPHQGTRTTADAQSTKHIVKHLGKTQIKIN